MRRVSVERENVPMGVGLYPNASGYGIHDKRTGDDNRLLAYGVGTTGAAVVSGLTAGAHRAVFGKSLMRSLMSIPRSGTLGYEKGIKEIFRPDAARDTLKDIAGKAMKGKARDVVQNVAGLRGRVGEYIDWGKMGKRFGKGLLIGGATGIAGKALWNAMNYHKDKALASDGRVGA